MLGEDQCYQVTSVRQKLERVAGLLSVTSRLSSCALPPVFTLELLLNHFHHLTIGGTLNPFVCLNELEI